MRSRRSAVCVLDELGSISAGVSDFELGSHSLQWRSLSSLSLIHQGSDALFLSVSKFPSEVVPEPEVLESLLFGYRPNNTDLIRSKICRISVPSEPPTFCAISSGRPHRSDLEVVAVSVKLSFFLSGEYSAVYSEEMPQAAPVVCLSPALDGVAMISSSVPRLRNYSTVRGPDKDISWLGEGVG